MDRFLGKGLELILVIEYVFLNLAWILALAVPMAVLVSTLMAFGRLSADNEISAMRSVSVSYIKLLIPVFIFGTCIAGFMMYFNNQILPEMNHKARMLSSDISRKRPDLEFDVGYFIDAIPNHNFLLGSRDGENFYDIIIFSNKEGNQYQTITAQYGTISTVENGVLLHLQNGVIHEYLGNERNDYQQIVFDQYQVMIPVDNLVLNRRNSSIRGDREMTFSMMQDKIASYENKIINTQMRIHDRLVNEAKKLKIDSRVDTNTVLTLFTTLDRIKDYEFELEDSLDSIEEGSIERVKRRLINLKRGVESDYALISSFTNSINRYKVELHKKFSIPFASIVFILIGAPLGIMARKGGFAVSMGFSLSFFVIYWVFLIGGEEFADRGFLSPALSMWLPNMILGTLGVYMCYRQSLELHVLSLDFLKLFRRKKEFIND